jgi:hypothetical protein
MLQQLQRGVAVIGIEADADADPDPHFDIVGEFARGFQGFDDAIGDPRGIGLLADVFQQDGEFVAPQPGHGVGPAQAPGQSLGDVLQ